MSPEKFFKKACAACKSSAIVEGFAARKWQIVTDEVADEITNKVGNEVSNEVAKK